MPVEEAVLAGEVCDQVLGCGQVQRAGVRAELLQDRLGDRGGAGDGGLGLDERGAPGVGEEFLDAEFGGFGEFQGLALLVDVQVFQAVGQRAGDLGGPLGQDGVGDRDAGLAEQVVLACRAPRRSAS